MVTIKDVAQDAGVAIGDCFQGAERTVCKSEKKQNKSKNFCKKAWVSDELLCQRSENKEYLHSSGTCT